jgi:hypothetical protein
MLYSITMPRTMAYFPYCAVYAAQMVWCMLLSCVLQQAVVLPASVARQRITRGAATRGTAIISSAAAAGELSAYKHSVSAK